MTWTHFPIFALSALSFSLAAALAAWKDRTALARWLSLGGICIFFSFILSMWISLERPPLRTMGETRLWYTFFISLAGFIVYSRWRYKWILSFSFVMALVFTCVNLFKTEIHNKTLMPALQSPWFAPHVTVYMFAYALFGASAVMAVYLLWIKRKPVEAGEMALCDNLVGVGLAFMTVGMLLGAIWAEQAWGHYWFWDPKETWAAATWLSYLTYIHLRRDGRKSALEVPPDGNASATFVRMTDRTRTALIILIVSFLLLQMCWYGINYLPSAQGASVHTYTR